MGSYLVWCWPMITFQPGSSAHLFSLVWGKMPQEKKKKNRLSPLLYQGQLLCEALDLPNQTWLCADFK